uniref:starch synthase n=1 Tax=Dunaliella tertiolecta TaxID=3047 RepID=A0A7S3R3Z4_DUNTE|mmetsp:Transcript_659/g.1677  ORF Transcript_659/g.1677 Transcript_659/m.1677 type:complete len:1236 (-) Transcript_659:1201-4908(-)
MRSLGTPVGSTQQAFGPSSAKGLRSVPPSLKHSSCPQHTRTAVSCLGAGDESREKVPSLPTPSELLDGRQTSCPIAPPSRRPAVVMAVSPSTPPNPGSGPEPTGSSRSAAAGGRGGTSSSRGSGPGSTAWEQQQEAAAAAVRLADAQPGAAAKPSAPGGNGGAAAQKAPTSGGGRKGGAGTRKMSWKQAVAAERDDDGAASQAARAAAAAAGGSAAWVSSAASAPVGASLLSLPLQEEEGGTVDSLRYAQDTKTLSVELDEEEVSPERAAARTLLATFNPSQHVSGREHWMVVVAPDNLMAGEECVLLFNKRQSDALRERPHVQLQYAFNGWELKNEEDAPFKADLSPAGTPITDMSEFWSTRFKVPEEAYEFNFVLHDNEGVYENNAMMDFMYPVAEGASREEWSEILAARVAQREQERQAAEARARAEAEALRQEELRKQDLEKGMMRAEGAKNAHLHFQNVGSVELRHGDSVAWCVSPSPPQAGSRMRLYYNLAATPLAWLGPNIPPDQAMAIRWGINGWQSPTVTVMTRSEPPAEAPQPGDWWQADLDLPYHTGAINLVFNYYEHYDNNNFQDYAIKVALPAGVTSVDAWKNSLVEVFRADEYATRVALEEEARRKEMKRLAKRQKAQDMVKAVERRKVRHVMDTEPEIITAGSQIDVWYNPKDTPLNGQGQIYLIGGWNRWSHRLSIGPMAMIPPDTPAQYNEAGQVVVPATPSSGRETHWKATVKVPQDAYKMDFVFANVPGGEGVYDNRGGYDYHLPVEGSPIREQSIYCVHIAVEMAPIAKVGGLGDVVTALGRAVQEQGHHVEVILPKFEFLQHSPILAGQLRYETEYDWGGTRIYVTSAIVENLRVWFVEPQNGFFQTQAVYGRYDDEVRFDFFCKAALEFLLRTGRQPDILHCHDWSTAHVAKAYWEDYNPYGLWKPKVVFTIHNLNYGQKKIAEAAQYCQRFTTVSPTYAFETGGAGPIAAHSYKFSGIRNGIDPDLWDTESNMFLETGYDAETVVEGKAAARAALRSRLGLTGWGDKFIVAVVSRLTPQKGVPLIKHCAFRTTERGGQFVLLGSAPDPRVQSEFDGMAASMGGQDAAFCFKYDEPLSHLIYAAADMVVVPSMFEPCGLTQMIAMRYGAVPIVRHTGGLKDTVFDVDYDKARAAWELQGSSDWQRDQLDATNGFAFEGTDPPALDYALNRAIDAWYNDRPWFHSLQRRVMEQDWSWNRPAMDYIELYLAALKT